MALFGAFHQFCRDIHTEAVDHIVGARADPWARPIVYSSPTEAGGSTSASPPPATSAPTSADSGVTTGRRWRSWTRAPAGRKTRLEWLNRLKAIAQEEFYGEAHPDFCDMRTTVRVGVRLGDVEDSRRACDHLAGKTDAAVAVELTALLGRAPW